MKNLMILLDTWSHKIVNPLSMLTQSRNRKEMLILIRDHDIICSETTAINRVLIIRLTLIVLSIFLYSRIYLHFLFQCVVTDGPFVHLQMYIVGSKCGTYYLYEV